MRQYGGQLMTTGAQAQVYADDFIAVHLSEIGGGQTYAQLSAKALAKPKNTALAAQVQTMFRGETLRGLLLNAYAFGTIGQLMLMAAIVAFAGAALLLILSVFGFVHLRRTAPEAEIFPQAATACRSAPPDSPHRLPAACEPPPGPPGGGCWRSAPGRRELAAHLDGGRLHVQGQPDGVPAHRQHGRAVNEEGPPSRGPGPPEQGRCAPDQRYRRRQPGKNRSRDRPAA